MVLRAYIRLVTEHRTRATRPNPPDPMVCTCLSEAGTGRWRVVPLGLAVVLAETPNKGTTGAVDVADGADVALAEAAAAAAAARAAFKASLLSARPVAIDVKVEGAVLSSSVAIFAMMVASRGATWPGTFTAPFTGPFGALRPLSGEEAEGGEAGAVGRSLKWVPPSELPCGDW